MYTYKFANRVDVILSVLTIKGKRNWAKGVVNTLVSYIMFFKKGMLFYNANYFFLLCRELNLNAIKYMKSTLSYNANYLHVLYMEQNLNVFNIVQMQSIIVYMYISIIPSEGVNSTNKHYYTWKNNQIKSVLYFMPKQQQNSYLCS